MNFVRFFWAFLVYFPCWILNNGWTWNAWTKLSSVNSLCFGSFCPCLPSAPIFQDPSLRCRLIYNVFFKFKKKLKKQLQLKLRTSSPWQHPLSSHSFSSIAFRQKANSAMAEISDANWIAKKKNSELIVNGSKVNSQRAIDVMNDCLFFYVPQKGGKKLTALTVFSSFIWIARSGWTTSSDRAEERLLKLFVSYVSQDLAEHPRLSRIRKSTTSPIVSYFHCQIRANNPSLTLLQQRVSIITCELLSPLIHNPFANCSANVHRIQKRVLTQYRRSIQRESWHTCE